MGTQRGLQCDFVERGVHRVARQGVGELKIQNFAQRQGVARQPQSDPRPRRRAQRRPGIARWTGG